MKKLLIIIMLSFILVIGFTGLRFMGAFFQEGNPIPYFISITKYELSNNEYEKVLETKDIIRYVSDYKKKDPLGMAKEMMIYHGWQFKERIGSGLVFEKDEELITISTRQFSRHYFIWDVPKEVMD